MVNNAKESTMVEDRLATLEARADTLEARLRALEEPRARTLASEGDAPPTRASAPMRAYPSAPAPASAPMRAHPSAPAPVSALMRAHPSAPVPPRPAARPRRDPVDVEDFLGGSVLAWLGGLFVVLGLAFLLTVAVSRGWLGEDARTGLAGLVSAALLAAGVRLRERRGRNDAALAAAAAGVAGLFGTLVAAGQVYELIPVPLALLGALAVGATATALAVRWRAPAIGWLGLVGALLAPAVLDPGIDGGDTLFLAVAYGATVAVLAWQRWTALAFTAFALTTPQWALWLLFETPSTAATLLTLTVFGALTTAAAVGFELRRRSSSVRIAAVVLLVLDAIVLDAAGWNGFESHAGASLWLVAVAAAHLAVGLAGTRLPRVSRELSLIALGLGVVLADVAFAALAGGLPLVLGWAAGAVGFGALLRRAGDARSDRVFAMAGLGGHLLAALVHALVIDVSSAALAGGGAGVEAILAVAAVGAGAAVSGRLATEWRVALDTFALAALAYVSALSLDGVALTAALAGQAVALTAIARRERDRVATWGALAFAGLAAGHALAVLAPPEALLAGLAHPPAAAGALLAAAAALLVAARAPFPDARVAGALRAAAALTLLYLASTTLVTPFQPGAGTAGLELGRLSIRQQGQALLSVLWALAGVGTLVTGLLADRAALRRGALVLLAITAGKVFLYDLSSLDSLARVGSVTALGLLMLCGGFAWQRVRPRALADLRDAGADAR